MSKVRPPAHCAVCGSEIAATASACPECGADERTGWREQDPTDGLDLPDGSFDHDAYLARENNGVPRKGSPLFWWVISMLMLALVGWLVLGKLF